MNCPYCREKILNDATVCRYGSRPLDFFIPLDRRFRPSLTLSYTSKFCTFSAFS